MKAGNRTISQTPLKSGTAAGAASPANNHPVPTAIASSFAADVIESSLRRSVSA
jgi:hypothetical protein